MAVSKPPKPIKLELNQWQVESEFFDDVQMLCLLCPHEPYHLAWHINRTLPFSLSRTPLQDINVASEFYVVYEFNDINNQILHYLIATRSKTRYILPELRNIDFIWMIKGGHLVDKYIAELPPILKSIPGVVDCRAIKHQILSQRQVFLL